MTTTRSFTAALGLVFLLLLSACSSDSAAEPAGDADAAAEPAEVIFEPVGEPGDDPFTPSMRVQLVNADNTAGPGLYGGSGENGLCDVDQFVASLMAEADKAAAWAEAAGIEVAELAEYIGSLEPTLLAGDTRVTNHGYRDGRATPFQSTLEAGTAVLVDDQGIPRARCACGNPLDEPTQATGEPVPAAPVTVPVPDPKAGSDSDPEPDPASSNEFCTVWAVVDPTISGGPTETGLTVDAYLDAMVDAFTRLVAAAEATDGFPSAALADLRAYLADLEIAAAAETPGPGDTDLRDRVENFILEYCADRPGQQEPGDDRTPTDDAPDGDAAATSANCGSFQFYLLVEAAEQLGIDHAAVSGPYLTALDAILAGVDPGSEFDVGDLAPMIGFEEVGCQGATAMQQLFADNGYGDLIEGTELGP